MIVGPLSTLGRVVILLGVLGCPGGGCTHDYLARFEGEKSQPPPVPKPATRVAGLAGSPDEVVIPDPLGGRLPAAASEKQVAAEAEADELADKASDAQDDRPVSGVRHGNPGTENTFARGEGDVFEATLQVLLKNYNIAFVDRSLGLVTTEWDSYYVGPKIFRNKVTVRVIRLGMRQVRVALYNNVQELYSAPGTLGDSRNGAPWVPAVDSGEESRRIIGNIARFLGDSR